MKSCIKIDAELFRKLDVKRGLRNEDGTGVLVGLTNIGNVVGYERTANGLKPIDGKLYFRGYEISDLVDAVLKEQRFGYEEVAYLLLSGRLPDAEELEQFRCLLVDNMPLMSKTMLNIVELEGSDIMNILARSVLELYTYDNTPDDISRDNLMRQSVELISKFPTIIAYAYNMLRHKTLGRSLHIRHPKENFSLAENFLYMLLGNHYTPLDARTLDLLLILQAEHGGGNNSTFTTRVVTSSGSDTYSVIAAAMSSLKGKKHGGANLMVMNMMDDIKENVKDYADEEEIAVYLDKLLNKQAFDKKGLIYGMGHAVYSISDPREKVFKGSVEQLATDKGRNEDMLLYNNIEKIAPRLIAEQRKIYKGVSPNIDFYSGFVYDMLDIPRELYTPLFAIARIVGWSAHRLEELITTDKIIRPAYKSLVTKKEYIDREKR